MTTKIRIQVSPYAPLVFCLSWLIQAAAIALLLICGITGEGSVWWWVSMFLAGRVVMYRAVLLTTRAVIKHLKSRP